MNALCCVFSLAGIVRPVILLDGHAAGIWKRSGKTVELTSFIPLQHNQRNRIEEEAERLWSGALQQIVWTV